MKERTKVILGGIIGGLSVLALVGVGFIFNLDKIKDDAETKAEDFIIDSIRANGSIQLEHSITGEPMVIAEDRL